MKIGTRNNVTTVTSYLAELTTRLSKLSAMQPQKQQQQLEQQLLTAGEDSILQENINQSYKKKDSENYLQYFQRVLNNPLTHQVSLNSISDAFTICQDLHILTSVSTGNKVLQKVLQEMIKYGNVYRQNAKNQLIKRPLNKVISRYHFLKGNIQEEEIKYIVNWIGEKGLQKEVFIQVMDDELGNIDEGQNNTQQRLKIRITNKVISCNNNGKRNNKKQPQSNKRQNPIRRVFQMSQNIQQQQQEQEQYDVYDTGRKKQKKSLERKRGLLIGNAVQERENKQNDVEKSMEKIFRTPEKMKIDLQEPNAPKKQYKSQYNERTTKPTTTNNNQQPTQPRRYTRIIDAKKDIIIKQDNNINSKEQQQQEQRKINVDTIKLNKTLLKMNRQIKLQTPRISEFVLYPYVMQKRNQDKEEKQQDENEDQVKQTVNDENNNEDNKKQQQVKLQQILREFQQKTKYSKVKILKLLDQVSGDLLDLREYLQTENKGLLWKRLEDAVLRKYMREKYKGEDNRNKTNHPNLKIQLMYNQLLTTKGIERITKRIKYLNLINNPKDNNKSPLMITA